MRDRRFERESQITAAIKEIKEAKKKGFGDDSFGYIETDKSGPFKDKSINDSNKVDLERDAAERPGTSKL